jgi:predicted GNAT family acetyltransferase
MPERRRECHGVVETLRDRHPTVLVGAREDARSITLERLIVPGVSRGRGLGSALMCDLIAYADSHRKQVRLTPSGAFGAAPALVVLCALRVRGQRGRTARSRLPGADVRNPAAPPA